MTDYHAYNQARNHLVAADQLLQAAAHHHGRGDPLAAHAQMERALKRVDAARSLLLGTAGPSEAPRGGQETLPP